MPQTQEHLAILDLLGISQGAVALDVGDGAGLARSQAHTGDVYMALSEKEAVKVEEIGAEEGRQGVLWRGLV